MTRCREEVDVTEILGRAGFRIHLYTFLASSVDAHRLLFGMVTVLVS